MKISGREVRVWIDNKTDEDPDFSGVVVEDGVSTPYWIVHSPSGSTYVFQTFKLMENRKV